MANMDDKPKPVKDLIERLGVVRTIISRRNIEPIPFWGLVSTILILIGINYFVWDGRILVLTLTIIVFLPYGILGIYEFCVPPATPFEAGLFLGPRSVQFDAESSKQQGWERSKLESQLLTAIRGGLLSQNALVIAGPSGVGKSHLLAARVLPQLQLDNDKWIISYPSTFRGLHTYWPKELKEALHTRNVTITTPVTSWAREYPPLLLIMDQFEQFIVHSEELEKQWLVPFLRASLELPNFLPVFVIRSDRFYDGLRELEKWQIMFNRVDVVGIEPTADKDAYEQLQQDLNTVTEDSKTAEIVMKELRQPRLSILDTILPVEAQIIGLVLENIREQQKRTQITPEQFFDELGGKEGLIRKFFEQCYKSSPIPDTGLRVLFALAEFDRLHHAISSETLSNVTHNDQEFVDKCVTFFLTYGLIRSPRDGLFELSHDYLAPVIRDLTGSELTSAERDNISFFAEKVATRKLSNFQYSRPNSKSKNNYYHSCLWLIPILLTVRLLSPSLNFPFNWLPPVGRLLSGSWPFEIHFIPIYLSITAWMIYVYRLYGKVFVHLNAARVGNTALFLKIVIVIIVIGGSSIAFFPHAWWTLISLAGILIATIFLSLARKLKAAKIAEVHYRRIGLIILVLNIVLLLVTGIALYFVHYYFGTQPVEESVEIFVGFCFWFFSVILIAICLIAGNHHTKTGPATEFLGFFDPR